MSMTVTMGKANEVAPEPTGPVAGDLRMVVTQDGDEMTDARVHVLQSDGAWVELRGLCEAKVITMTDGTRRGDFVIEIAVFNVETPAIGKIGAKLGAQCTLLKRKADGTLVDHNDQRVMVAFPDGSELR